MLQIRGLTKSFGMQNLFDDVSLQMEAGERLGLVGRNGHGKSTLLRIILDEEHPDAGDIIFPKNYRVGYLKQHLDFTRPTVVEEGALGLPPGDEEHLYKVEKILFGLGFSKADLTRSPAEFSGGYQIRINLAKLLVSEPNLLLLDEPTNYLDIVSTRWIINFLRSWPGELIVISHDRDFMDAVTTHTAGIHRQKIRKVRGGTQKLYEQILLEEEIHEKTRVNDEKKRAQMQVFIDRFRAKNTKATVVQSRIKMLEKMPQLERLEDIEALEFRFGYRPIEAKTPLAAENLSFAYPGGSAIVSDFSLAIGRKDRIGVIGKNGRGKSTLLGLLAGELQPGNGAVRTHPDARVAYFGQTNIERLNPNVTVEDEIAHSGPGLERTRIRGICGIMMFDGDKAEKSVSCLSGGERSRVLLGKILATPANLLLLDEPTNHLDMESIEAMVEALETFPGAVVIVTHSEMILRAVATKLVVFDRGRHEVFPGTYDEFLERIGWGEDENIEAPRASEKKSGRKLDRQRRAEIIQERSRVVGPLKKRMDAIEREIIALEDKLREWEVAIVTASEKGDGKALAQLALDMGQARKQIDKLFDELTVVTAEHDEKAGGFEVLLRDSD